MSTQYTDTRNAYNNISRKREREKMARFSFALKTHLLGVFPLKNASVIFSYLDFLTFTNFTYSEVATVAAIDSNVFFFEKRSTISVMRENY